MSSCISDCNIQQWAKTIKDELKLKFSQHELSHGAPMLILPLCSCIAHYGDDLYLYCVSFQKENIAPEHKTTTTTICSKKATQHLFILKTFGQF
jgi:hypothetical protein